MNRYLFEILCYIQKNGEKEYSIRDISDSINISGNTVIKWVQYAVDNGLLNKKDELLSVSDKGILELEPYRVKKAVILAAGLGSRLLPATSDKPKPLVSVNGKKIIETLLDSLMSVGIDDIIIVRGYKKDKFDELLVKYPFIKFIDNNRYDRENNISSVIAALDEIDGCYLCEADLYISNSNIITQYQYSSNILGAYSLETDDWSFKMLDGYISDYKKGNTYCYNYYGISYWTAEDSKKLRLDWKDIYLKNKDVFWEEVPLIYKKENYKVEIRQCLKSDVMEIDNYYELAELDHSYR